MRIIQEKGADIDLIVNVLEKGGLVIFPCETVYGIACDSANPQAVAKLNQYKKRPLGKPYAIMVSDQEMAERYVILNKTAHNLYQKFLPGPLTVVSKLRPTNTLKSLIKPLAEGIASENNTLGVRLPDYGFILGLIKIFGRPVVATSANSSYQKRPYKLSDIFNNISNKQKGLVDLVIDAGELPHNEPSTVIDTTLDDLVVLRQGEIVAGEENSIISRNEEQTKNCGKELWQKYAGYAGQRAIVFALEDEMGTGKTQFTKGLAKALGVVSEVVSPTFNLEIEYDTTLPFSLSKNKKCLQLIHIDAWRLENGQELEALGYKGFISNRAILAIEWADRVIDIIRKYDQEAIVVRVSIQYTKKETERKISWLVL